MLIEQGLVPSTVLPLAEFAAHLRVGTGLDPDNLQAELLEGYLRSSLAVIEGRTGKALISRRCLWTGPAWSGGGSAQALPIAPVSEVVEVALVGPSGPRQVLPESRWCLRPDLHRPRVEAVGPDLPPVPAGGRAEILFEAGFGSTWASVPADLRQAVLLLAAEFYELRHSGSEVPGGLPATVLALIEGWRTVRLFGGRA